MRKFYLKTIFILLITFTLTLLLGACGFLGDDNNPVDTDKPSNMTGEYKVSFSTEYSAVFHNPPTYFVDNIYHEFLGWYDNENCEGEALPAIPQRDMTLYAKWGEAQIGFNRVTVNEKTYVTLGEAPCTLASEAIRTALATGEADGTITADEKGYYHYQGKRYARRTAPEIEIWKGGERVATPKFSDGTPIVKGVTYYFEVEPIRWQILGSNETSYSLVPVYLYDLQIYDDSINYSNKEKWANSELKAWLADEYYPATFSALEMKFIRTISSVKVRLMDYDEIKRYKGTDEGKAMICDYGRLAGRISSVTATVDKADETIWYGSYWSMTKDADGVSDLFPEVWPAYVYYYGCDGYIGRARTGEYSYQYVRPYISIMQG